MTDKSLTFASIAAAGLASLCCIGPLAAVALGIGSFSAASVFEGLRPYLLGLTALLLTGAFYLNYRKRPEAECVDETCAVSPEKKRKRAMLLWLATGAVAALAAFPNYSGVLSGETANPETAAAASNGEGQAVAVFAVDGMTCAACAVGVKATLEREKGVTLANVDYEKETARIRFYPSQTSAEKLIAAIGELGYSAKLEEPQS